MRELRALLASSRTEAEREAAVDRDVQSWRDQYGVEHTFASRESIKQWDTDSEIDAYIYAERHGLDAAVVRDALADYIQHREGNEAIPDDVLDRLEKKYQARGVPKAVTAEYRRWLRARGYA